MVTKTKNSVSKKSGEKTLSQVSVEMAKPRITASARAASLVEAEDSDPKGHHYRRRYAEGKNVAGSGQP